MPWEEDTPLPEGVSRSKAGNALSYAASIGLEISGSREFVTDACALVLEFRDIFSTELSPEPADLPPLDVPIDTAKWHQPRNQGRSCNQSETFTSSAILFQESPSVRISVTNSSLIAFLFVPAISSAFQLK